LDLVGTYRKFIPYLEILVSLFNILTILSKPEFEKYMKIKINKIALLIAMDTIKVLVTSDPYLVLPQNNINICIV
jgi:hypothetical protein